MCVEHDAGRDFKKGIGSNLRELYPNGHPRFTEILTELAKLHSDKNYDYARGGDPLGNFYRCAEMLNMNPARYAWALTSKQIDGVNWAFRKGGEQKAESVWDKLRDIAVYSILIMILLEQE